MTPSTSVVSSPQIINRKKRLAHIRALQEEALAKLPHGGLYIMLYNRSDPPELNDFHWGLYHHFSGEQGGNKYHVNGGSQGWMTDFGITRGALRSQFLSVVVQIATIPSSAFARFNNLVHCKDHELNQIPGVSCSVWQILILQKVIDAGLMKCDSLTALREDCLQFGNEHASSGSKNQQPRPVVEVQGVFCAESLVDIVGDHATSQSNGQVPTRSAAGVHQ